jgi:hypothetical protein
MTEIIAAVISTFGGLIVAYITKSASNSKENESDQNLQKTEETRAIPSLVENKKIWLEIFVIYALFTLLVGCTAAFTDEFTIYIFRIWGWGTSIIIAFTISRWPSKSLGNSIIYGLAITSEFLIFFALGFEFFNDKYDILATPKLLGEIISSEGYFIILHNLTAALTYFINTRK